jgi:hypothetical protein
MPPIGHGKFGTKKDRLPILVTGFEIEQLLAVAVLESGTGEQMAAASFDSTESWGVTQNIVALSFDTTSSNTGRLNGACVLLNIKLAANCSNSHAFTISKR